MPFCPTTVPYCRATAGTELTTKVLGKLEVGATFGELPIG